MLKPAVRPTKTDPTNPTPDKEIVCVIAKPAKPDTIIAPRHFLMSYLESSELRNPLMVFNIAPDTVARTTTINGSTIPD